MFKKTKGEYIIAWFVLSIIFLSTFLLILFFKTYPDFKELEQKKDEAVSMVRNYNEVKKKWIPYEDFKRLQTPWDSSVYLQNIFNEIDNNFFTKNFNNTWTFDFDIFFTEKVKEINDVKNSPEYIKNIELYKKILPSYVENAEKDDTWLMSDFKFINYIESILFTFNLESANKTITIDKLQPVPDLNNPDSIKSWLENALYFIPYEFNVSWRKSDILDFVYFLENVWSMSISDTDNSIKIPVDNFIKKPIVWFKNSNVLENPIMDIDSITFPEYIDSWLSKNTLNEEFVQFLKNKQWLEVIDVNIKANFYFKWLPGYKIQESITKLAEKHDLLLKSYTNLVNKSKLSDVPDSNIVNIEKWMKYLQELSPTIKSFKAAKNDLNNVYKNVLETSKILDILSNYITVKK